MGQFVKISRLLKTLIYCNRGLTVKGQAHSILILIKHNMKKNEVSSDKVDCQLTRTSHTGLRNPNMEVLPAYKFNLCFF